VQDALKELQHIKQGKNGVDELNTKFRMLMAKAGLHIIVNNMMLTQLYEQALDRRIAQQIILNGVPETLDEWMRKASTMDSAYKGANQLFSNGIQHQNKNQGTFKPRFYSNASSSKNDNYRGEPMDIDHVDAKEIEKRRAAKACFKCGKTGHFAKDHQEKEWPKTNGGTHQAKERPAFQGNKVQGKKPQPKKKMNTGQMCHHIRALIDENFEENSAEYEEFINEVGEQGF